MSTARFFHPIRTALVEQAAKHEKRIQRVLEDHQEQVNDLIHSIKTLEFQLQHPSEQFVPDVIPLGEQKAFIASVCEEAQRWESGYESEIVQEQVRSFVNANGTSSITKIIIGRSIPRALLIRMQDAVFEKGVFDPLISAVLKNYLSYVLGQGLSWDTPDQEVKDWLQEFWEANQMNTQQRILFRQGMIDGELFLALFKQEEGNVLIRRIESSEIVAIERDPDDREKELSFRRVFTKTKAVDKIEDLYYPAHDYEGDPKSEQHAKLVKTPLLHLRTNPLNESTVIPPFIVCLKWSKLYENYVVDAARRHHEYSRIFLVETYEGTVGRRDGETRRPVPDGGKILREDRDTQYKFITPNAIQASEKVLGLTLLHMVCAGAIMPAFILNQDADSKTYAAIRKADTPFAQGVIAWQMVWENELLRLFRYVVKQGVEAGPLPEETTVVTYDEEALESVLHQVNEWVVYDYDITEEDIQRLQTTLEENTSTRVMPTEEVPIDIIFPAMIQEDPVLTAKVLEIHQKVGIVSTQTLSERAGYNWTRELARMAREKVNKDAAQETDLSRFIQGLRENPPSAEDRAAITEMLGDRITTEQPQVDEDALRDLINTVLEERAEDGTGS